MNRLLTLLLAIVMLTQSITALWAIVGFYINQDTIARTQCEYRYIETNTCLGRCVLIKVLQTQQEKEQQAPQYKFVELVLFSPIERTALRFLPAGFSMEKRRYGLVDDQYQFDTIHSIFHPPIA